MNNAAVNRTVGDRVTQLLQIAARASVLIWCVLFATANQNPGPQANEPVDGESIAHIEAFTGDKTSKSPGKLPGDKPSILYSARALTKDYRYTNKVAVRWKALDPSGNEVWTGQSSTRTLNSPSVTCEQPSGDCRPIHGYTFPYLSVRFDDLGTYDIQAFPEGATLGPPLATFHTAVMDDMDVTAEGLHERYGCADTSAEIPGDGFEDPFEYPGGLKDLVIELDYTSAAGPHLQNIMASVESILATAGVAVHWVPEPEMVSTNSSYTPTELRDILASERDNFGAVHVVIVPSTSASALQSALGVTVDFLSFPNDLINNSALDPKHTIMECYNMRMFQDSLNRTGVIVFYDPISAAFNSIYPPGLQSLWHSKGHCIGMVVAHELGHALGILRHSEFYEYGSDDIMKESFVFQDPDPFNNYDALARFDPRSLTNIPCSITDGYLEKGMNLRRILGIERVDLGGENAR